MCKPVTVPDDRPAKPIRRVADVQIWWREPLVRILVLAPSRDRGERLAAKEHRDERHVHQRLGVQLLSSHAHLVLAAGLLGWVGPSSPRVLSPPNLPFLPSQPWWGLA